MMRIIVLAYHRVDRRFDVGITRVKPRQFERQMAWLADSGYSTCSLSDCLDRNRPRSSKEIVLTFDDGYQSLRRYALPVLDRLEFRATVFPVAAYVGRQNRWDANLFWRRHRHLDWGELRELVAAGWEVGSHSLRHDYLPLLSPAELEFDLRTSREILEDNLQIPIRHLSLPFGRGNSEVFHCALAAGFQSVVTLGQHRTPLVSTGNASGDGVPGKQLVVIPRRGVYLHDTIRSFRRRVETGLDSRRERVRQQVISLFAMGTVLVKAAGDTFHGKKLLES